MTYTIKEASDITGIPATTLRYYDKEGILPFLERKESGHRMFSEQDLSMLRIIECLKCTGMSIKDIRQYAVWAQMGDSTLEQRYNLFLERREAVMAQIKELEDQLKVIDYKCKYYEEALPPVRKIFTSTKQAIATTMKKKTKTRKFRKNQGHGVLKLRALLLYKS